MLSNSTSAFEIKSFELFQTECNNWVFGCILLGLKIVFFALEYLNYKGKDITFCDKKNNFKIFKHAFLTNREQEILLLLVNGNETKEIATALSISTETVGTHRKNLLRKTKARNTAEMISMSIRKGWV